MSTTYHVTINGNYAQTSLGHITMGDTVVVTVGSGFDNCTHYKLRIIDNYGLEVWKPGEELYTPQTTFTYTFEDRANTDYINSWGGGLVIGLRGYKQITSRSRTYYSLQSSGTASGYLQVDTTKYRPTMSFGDVTINKSYNGLALAGISTISSTLSTGHLNSSDKATLNDPKLILGNDNYLSSNNAVTLNGTTVTSTDTVPTSDESYHIWFKGYIQDSRYVYQDGAMGPLPWAISTQDNPTYVESAKVLVYPYALPTYDPNHTYVNRCASSGRPDGMGNNVRVHITYDISDVNGNNNLVGLSLQLSGKTTYEDPINSNYLTAGYADYIIEIDASSETTLTVWIKDEVCEALELTSKFTLKIPTATLPLSLFDDGINRGTAFGQMATRAGNWFYNNLVYVRNDLPYLLDIHKNTPVARQLCGDTGTSTVRVYCSVESPNNTAGILSVYLYDLGTQIVSLADYQGLFNKYVDVPIGALLLITNNTTQSDYKINTIIVNGRELTNDDIYTMGTGTQGLLLGAYVYYYAPTENTNIKAYFGNTQPTIPERPKLTVDTNTTTKYSFSDEDNVHVSDSQSLTLYGASSSISCRFKLSQYCINKRFLYWVYNGTKYSEDTMKNTGITMTTSNTVTAMYDELLTQYDIVIPSFPVGQLSKTLMIKNNSNNLTLLSRDWTTSSPGSATIKVDAGTSIYIWYVNYDDDTASLYINGTKYTASFGTREITIDAFTVNTNLTIALN